MVTIIYLTNPFDPNEKKTYRQPAGGTVLGFLKSIYGEAFEKPERPTVVALNTEYILQDEWDRRELQPGDTLVFTVLPGWEGVIIAIVVAVVVAVAVAVLMPTPQIPGEVPNADPVYTLKGQTNQTKLMDPIEVPYGRCRIFPSYAARPFNLYAGNEQFQFVLLCVGQGWYDIANGDVQIEDTPLANFQEAQFEIIPPGGQVTLFPDNVITSAEIGNIQLFGPNKAEYPAPDGWFGPFVLNDPGTRCNRIEYDITFPNGLFENDEGDIDPYSVQIQFQRQRVDDFGNPVGSWEALGDHHIQRATNTPQRITFGNDVPEDRWQIRGRRTSNEPENLEFSSACYWEAARAFMPSTKEYGNVTLIAIKIQATNNLNDQTRSRYNLYATRKLPQWDAALNGGAGGWTDPIATRSIVWAFIDIFRNRDYGCKLDDRFLDMPGLLNLQAYYSATGKTFDWIFDQRITAWEAAKAVARMGRAVPMLFGSKVGMVRDFAKSIPTAIFTPDNMVKGSFRYDVAMHSMDPVDHVVVEYIDPVTWKPETVLCAINGTTQDNGEQFKLAGCTDRTQAYREGLYVIAGKILWREQLTFKTGLEGNIPMYGDLISVSHDIPRWNQFGTVLSVDNCPAGMRVRGALDPDTMPGYVPYIMEDPNAPGAGFYSTNAEVFPLRQFYWAPSDSRWLYQFNLSETEYIIMRSAVTTLGASPNPAAATGWEHDISMGGAPDPTGDMEVDAVPVFRRVTLSKDVTFGEPWVTCALSIRTKKGGAIGPLAVRESYVADKLDIVEAFDDSLLEFDQNKAPVSYLFGVNDPFNGLFQITNLAPANDDTVEVTCTNYAPGVHIYDAEIPPDVPDVSVPPATPDLPEVRGIVVGRPPGFGGFFQINASWIPTPGAEYYRVEISNDGFNWTPRGNTTVPNHSETVYFAQDFWIRVAAFRAGLGPWTQWNGEVGFATAPPAKPVGLELASAWTGTTLGTLWQPSPYSQGYRVRMKATVGGTTLREDTVQNTSYNYTIAMMLADAPAAVRDLTIEVASVNSAGPSAYVTLAAHNDPPAALSGFLSAYNSQTPTTRTFNLSWNASPAADLSKYRVWASLTSGFTPGPGNLVYEGTVAGFQYTIPREVGGNTLARYWRAAALDVWGEEVNLAAEQTLAAMA